MLSRMRHHIGPFGGGRQRGKSFKKQVRARNDGWKSVRARTFLVVCVLSARSGRLRTAVFGRGDQLPEQGMGPVGPGQRLPPRPLF